MAVVVMELFFLLMNDSKVSMMLISVTVSLLFDCDQACNIHDKVFSFMLFFFFSTASLPQLNVEQTTTQQVPKGERYDVILVDQVLASTHISSPMMPKRRKDWFLWGSAYYNNSVRRVYI